MTWKPQLLLAAPLLLAAALPVPKSKRPQITGINHVSFYTTHPEEATQFYTGTLGLPTGAWPGLYVVGKQGIELENKPAPHPPAMLSHVAFDTDDAEALRAFIAARAADAGVKLPGKVNTEKNGTRWFAMADPEGTPIEFVEDRNVQRASPDAISDQVIHAGFVVHDRAAEDRFYRDLLRFRLYWHGGMQEGHTDWVSMQLPDGRQWVEYMLLPPDAKPDARLLGVLNHVALGVSDTKASEKYLLAHGWKPTEESKRQLGRDGKWQLNVYDPDGTRVELMDFAPVAKPCCSKFAAEHPRK
jgi:catechol 2,3-dioxygenase-like lactoylglutathione lyase family enzyme